jgi:hypothetical protein
MIKLRNTLFHSSVLLFLAASVAMLSCSSPTAAPGGALEQGSLVLSFHSGSRTIAPTLSEIEGYVDHFDIVLQGPGGERIEIVRPNPSGSLTENFDLGNFAAGNWLISVYAEDASHTAIAEKLSVPAVIPAGGASVVDVNLGPSGGVGSLNVAIQWPGTLSIPSIQGTFQPQGGATTTLDFSSITTSGQNFSLGSLSSGNYLLTIFLYDGEVKLATKLEAVQVFSGIETQGTISFDLNDVNTPPGPVTTRTQRSPSGGTVTLEWETTDPYTKGYIIERRMGAETEYSEIVRGIAGPTGPFGTSAPFEYVDIVEQDIVAYFVDYRIKAYNIYGESSAENWLSYEITPINVPVISGLGWDTYIDTDRPTWTWTNPNSVLHFGVVIEDGNGVRPEVPVSLSQATDTPIFVPAFDVLEGEVTLTVREAGELSADTYTAYVDLQDPTLTFDPGPIITNQTFSINYTVDDTGAPENSGVGEYLWSIASGGTGQGLVNFTDAGTGNSSIFITDSGTGVNGTYRVNLQVTDRAGNVTNGVKEFIWDQDPPDIPLIDPILTNSVYDMPTLTIVDDHISSPGYVWTELSGPGDILFTDKFSSDTSIGANIGGNYVIRLNVTDDAGNTSTRDFDFHWDDEAPEVDAGDTVITNSLTVAMNGIATDGPTALSDIASREWSIVNTPSNPEASISISDNTALDTEVSATQGGVYTLRLNATDQVGLTASDTVEVRVDTLAPVVSLGTLYAVGDEFQFSDLSVTDNLQNGYASEGFTYQWTETSSPGNVLRFDPGPNEAMPLISTRDPQSPADDGLYTIQLVVTDAAGNSSLPAIAEVLIDHNPPDVSGKIISVDQGTANGFRLTWELAEDGDAAGIQYRISTASGPTADSDIVNENGTFRVELDWSDSFLSLTSPNRGRASIVNLPTGEIYYKIEVRDSLGNMTTYPIQSTTLTGSASSAKVMSNFSLLDHLGNPITATENDSAGVFQRNIANSVDKRRIILVFDLSPGATVQFNSAPVVSGVTEVDLSAQDNVFTVRAEDTSTATYTVKLRYNGTELTSFVIGNGNAFVPTDRVGIFTGNDITVDIPFRTLAGAFFKADIIASSGATVRIGGVTLVEDQLGAAPGVYSTAKTSTDVDYSIAGDGIASPTYSPLGLATFRATITVWAEDEVTNETYNLILQETDASEIPNGTFIFITDMRDTTASWTWNIYLGAEYDSWGMTFIDRYYGQMYRFIDAGAVDAASLSGGDDDKRFELQFLDGNNWSDDTKYSFSIFNMSGRDGSMNIDNEVDDPRILIDHPDSAEDIAPGDVIILHLDLPAANDRTLPVDSVIIDRT